MIPNVKKDIICSVNIILLLIDFFLSFFSLGLFFHFHSHLIPVWRHPAWVKCPVVPHELYYVVHHAEYSEQILIVGKAHSNHSGHSLLPT